jgi:hypothetical protein
VPVSYRIYGNGGGGGPIDYTTPLATTASLTWTSGALAAGSRWRFGLRAFDTTSGLEETNVDAVVALDLNTSRIDITNLPVPPEHLTVDPIPGGAVVHWSYPFTAAANRPNAFFVYIGSPAPDYGTILATVAYIRSPIAVFRATLTGLTPGVTYQVGVRAANATGEEGNTTVASVTIPASAPSNVDSLTGTATATA